MRLVELKVSGVGCASCVAPAKEHFLKLPEVLAVHVLGSRIYLLIDGERSVEEVVSRSGAEDYYIVTIEKVEPVSSVGEALERIMDKDKVALKLLAQ